MDFSAASGGMASFAAQAVAFQHSVQQQNLDIALLENSLDAAKKQDSMLVELLQSSHLGKHFDARA